MKKLNEEYSNYVNMNYINSYLKCPRILYFRVSSVENRYKKYKDCFSHIQKYSMKIERELIQRLPKIIIKTVKDYGTENIEKVISSSSKNVFKTIEQIKKEILFSEKLNNIFKEKEIEDAAEIIKRNTDIYLRNSINSFLFFGREFYEILAYPDLEEYYIYSEFMEFGGNVSKIISFPEELIYDLKVNILNTISKTDFEKCKSADKNLKIPYIIKLVNPPANGVWRNDRIAAAGYSLLIRERFFGTEKNEKDEKNIKEMNNIRKINNIKNPVFIDYLGVLRVVYITENDEKLFFRTLQNTKEIMNGNMPPIKRNALCKNCFYKDSCNPTPKRLFDLF